MIDADLVELYGVPTKALNQAVRRNAARFPEDFMFRLEAADIEALNRSQFVTGSQRAPPADIRAQKNPALRAAPIPTFAISPICMLMFREAGAVTLLVHIRRTVPTSVSARFAP